MTTDTPGIVYLVGAGPGDPELLTLRAHRLLQRCDALVHDSLVPMELLELVPEGCEIHPVGKRRGRGVSRLDESHSLRVPTPAAPSALRSHAPKHHNVAADDEPATSTIQGPPDLLPPNKRCRACQWSWQVQQQLEEKLTRGRVL